MSDFFLQTAIAWNKDPERQRRDYEVLHRSRLQLEQRNKEVEQADPLARRFDVGDFK